MNNRHYTIAAAALVIATAVHADDSSVAAKSTTSSSGGEAVYSTICQGCHMPGGTGAEGAGHYPKLAGNPALVKVRNSNTGARADAGSREEFVFDKLNTILKRLNVYGYRHYHNFDDWMRRTLLETVQAELLSPTAHVQAFVDRRALENLIRETREGKANRSYLLQVLLILELWQRENGVTAAG